jgi:transcriptional regulator of acetoin/glycerol metabolism
MSQAPDWLTLETPPLGLWERFREGAWRAQQTASRSVVERWQRIRALEAPPDGGVEPIDERGALAERRERLGPLLHGLPQLFSAKPFADRDFSLLLADADGVVLERTAGGGFDDEARRVRLIEGSHWSEATRGTNAIGTAIAEDRPVAVHGRAHWMRPNHSLVCYAAPVHDAAGALVAVLDATSFVERADPFAQLAVRATALALEEHLRRYAWQTSRPLELVERLIDGQHGPALLVEPPGRVRRANAAGAAVMAAHRRVDWLATSRAALTGERVQLGAASFRVEPLFDDADRLIAAVLIGDAPARRAPVPTPQPAAPSPFQALDGDDPALRATTEAAARLARTSLPLLLLAETGTGKDVLARAIHRAGPRAERPFVALNCGALGHDLLESELFGYAPGAFTGALRTGRDGHLAHADGGTLFLDEVAEMPAALQALLLRFLEDGTYRRVGDPTEHRADVRLLCATCRDLPALVAEGRFRADLYYRIRGASLSLPPLRRRADLPLLAARLLDAVAREQGVDPPRLGADALAALTAWPWPGNVRELKNALRVAVVLADGEPLLTVRHLPPELSAAPRVEPRVEPQVEPRVEAALDAVEAQAVRRAVDAAQGNLSEAARRLGVARSTLYRLLERHHLR